MFFSVGVKRNESFTQNLPFFAVYGRIPVRPGAGRQNYVHIRSGFRPFGTVKCKRLVFLGFSMKMTDEDEDFIRSRDNVLWFVGGNDR